MKFEDYYEIRRMDDFKRVHYYLLTRWIEAMRSDSEEDLDWYVEALRLFDAMIPDVENIEDGRIQ